MSNARAFSIQLSDEILRKSAFRARCAIDFPTCDGNRRAAALLKQLAAFVRCLEDSDATLRRLAIALKIDRYDEILWPRVAGASLDRKRDDSPSERLLTRFGMGDDVALEAPPSACREFLKLLTDIVERDAPSAIETDMQRTSARRRQFAETTGARRTEPGRPFWPLWTSAPSALDHASWWHATDGVFLCGEPYCDERPVEPFARELVELGCRAVALPRGFGIWSPPGTRLILIAPPDSDADLSTIAARLLAAGAPFVPTAGIGG